jgi:GT2 family glycosyltransferase
VNARISVITPVYNPDLNELRDCLESARAKDVEHILVLDGIQNVRNLRALKKLAKKYKAKLEILEKQRGISEASNIGAEKSQSDFLLFLDQDDFLTSNWIDPVLQVIDEHDVIYSDSFIANSDGKTYRINRKPDWSPVRLIFNMYAVHFLAVRREVFWQVGAFRSDFDGSQDHDLALRLSRFTNRVKHLPLALYSWRESQFSTATNPENKSWAYDAGLAASEDHLKLFSPNASVEKIADFPGALRARFQPRNLPLSVVVPTAFSQQNNGVAYLANLIHSLLPFLSSDLDDEIVIVHGGEKIPSDVRELMANSKIPFKVVRDKDEFNFSQRCNIGFSISSNEHILLLNDDLEFGQENPLDSLFGLLNLPNVGLVGGLLVFPDYSIQHGGHAFTGGNAHHSHYQGKSLKYGLMDLVVDHEVVGVTGALMFQTKETWKAVGGFSALFPLNFNDVDYCQKIRTLGYEIIQANSVTAFHHESVTRESKVETWEREMLDNRWFERLSRDEYQTSM